jgi:hypothetical protein
MRTEQLASGPFARLNGAVEEADVVDRGVFAGEQEAAFAPAESFGRACR